MLENDIFISYSSADRLWAARLKRDLSNHGVRCFLDVERLSLGNKWQPQLLDNLRDSRHLVVLWSDHARNSDWVSEELYRFKALIDPGGEGRGDHSRLLFAINLQGRNMTLNAWQGYGDPALQAAYANGPVGGQIQLEPAAAAAWNGMVGEIADAATASNPASPVPLVVLALTESVFNRFPPVVPDFVQADLDKFLNDLGVVSKASLLARYGPTPFDWRPFGTEETILQLLDDLLLKPNTGVNAKLAQVGKTLIRWNPVDIVTPPFAQLSALMQPLQSGPAVIVIDPVSLFSFATWQRYAGLQKCFLNPLAAIMMLTPFSPPSSLQYLRQCLLSQSRPVLDEYFDPIPFNPNSAICALDVDDQMEMRRIVLASLGRQPGTRPAGGAGILN